MDMQGDQPTLELFETGLASGQAADAKIAPSSSLSSEFPVVVHEPRIPVADIPGVDFLDPLPFLDLSAERVILPHAIIPVLAPSPKLAPSSPLVPRLGFLSRLSPRLGPSSPRLVGAAASVESPMPRLNLSRAEDSPKVGASPKVATSPKAATSPKVGASPKTATSPRAGGSPGRFSFVFGTSPKLSPSIGPKVRSEDEKLSRDEKNLALAVDEHLQAKRRLMEHKQTLDFLGNKLDYLDNGLFRKALLLEMTRRPRTPIMGKLKDALEECLQRVATKPPAHLDQVLAKEMKHAGQSVLRDEEKSFMATLASSSRTIPNAASLAADSQKRAFAAAKAHVRTPDDLRVMLEVDDLNKIWPCMFAHVISECFSSNLLHLAVVFLRKHHEGMDWDVVLRAALESRFALNSLRFLDKLKCLGRCTSYLALSEAVDRRMWVELEFLSNKVDIKVFRKAFRYSALSVKLTLCTESMSLAHILTKLVMEDMFVAVKNRKRCAECALFHGAERCGAGSDDPDYDYEDDNYSEPLSVRRELQMIKHMRNGLVQGSPFEAFLKEAVKSEEFVRNILGWGSCLRMIYTTALEQKQPHVLALLVEHLKLNIDSFDILDALRDEDLRAVLPYCSKERINSEVKLAVQSPTKLEIFVSCGLDTLCITDEVLDEVFTEFDEKMMEALAVCGADWPSLVSGALEARDVKYLKFLVRVKVPLHYFHVYLGVPFTLEKVKILVEAGASPSWIAQSNFNVITSAVESQDDESLNYYLDLFGWRAGKEVVCMPTENMIEIFNKYRSSSKTV